MTKIQVNEDKKTGTSLLDMFKKGPATSKFNQQGSKPVAKQANKYISPKTARGQSR